MKRRIFILSLILLASAYFTIFVCASANDSEIWFDKATYAGYGARPIVTLKDEDLNRDPKRRDEVNITVNSTTDPAGITVKLIETLSNSGEFSGDFGVSGTKSDSLSKILRISNKDTITAIYKETNPISGTAKEFTRSVKWQASTGTVKLMKSSYTGLNTMATVSVTDKDMDLRSAYIDTVRIRIYSDTDPKGIVLTAYETGPLTSTFAVSFGFDTERSNIGDAVIKVSPSDKIYAEYIDEIDENGTVNVNVTSTATFQFAEAAIKTSAANDQGEGNVLTVTIDEPDANNPKSKDRILAKANAYNGTQEKTLWLQETGANTGSFKCSLFLNDEMTTADSLMIKSSDIINIKYVDCTVPLGGTKEIVKAVKWDYISTLLRADKDVYSGYSAPARITLTDFNLNTDEERAENIDVKVTTSDSKGIKLELKETNANSGIFTGTLYFGKMNKVYSGTLKVVDNETITVTYTNPKDKDDYTECSFKWSFQDGQITLDRGEYKGNDAPVKVTVRDLDASDDTKKKDEIKVVVRTPGGVKDTNVVLTETSNSSGNYTGTFYINGSTGNRPSISLQPGDKFDVIYVDEHNTSGKDMDRIAPAAWGGISKATLTINKQKYTGYGNFMTITLVDPDQNKSSTSRDKVTIAVRTRSGKTNTIYTLTESSNDIGEFMAVLEFTEEPYTDKKICVAPDDIIFVDFFDKKVNAYATFTK